MTTQFRIIPFGVFLISFIRTGCHGNAETATLQKDTTGTTATAIKMAIILPSGGTTTGVTSIGEINCDGTACPAADVTESFGSDPPTVTIGGRTPSTKYTIEMKTFTASPASPGLADITAFEICTVLDDITDVKVDEKATNEKEIKITWAASTGTTKPSYTLYLDDNEIGTVAESAPTEFIFTEANTKDKVELSKTTAHKCKIVATADAGCGASTVNIEETCSLKTSEANEVKLGKAILIVLALMSSIRARVS